MLNFPDFRFTLSLTLNLNLNLNPALNLTPGSSLTYDLPSYSFL